ncbi:Ig-like domain-containing protein, partial [Alphaproteobacteria bacterium]|nr:Ig-like domain-containing protein [Alphaproteobacteria bacterium]
MIKKISNLINFSYVLFIAFLILIFSNLLFNKAEATPTFVSDTSISSQESSPNAIAFNNDGSKMFIAGQGSGGRIHEYSLSTAFDSSTRTHESSFATATDIAEELYPAGLAFNNDGTKMYTLGQRYNKVIQYNLTTGFDISTASFSQVKSVNTTARTPQGIAFNNDGSKMFIATRTYSKVIEYTLSSAFDISTTAYVRGYSTADQTGNLTGDVEFNSSGTKMYVTDATNDKIHVYSLTSAFNLSSVSFLGSLSIADKEAVATGMSFNADGTKMFIVGSDGDDVNEYSLSAAYTLLDSTAPTLSSSTPTDNATDVAVDSNIVLNFSESVDVESGNITIKKTSDNSVIETIDVTSSNITGTGSSQITINPSNNLDKGVEYYILISATAFDDSAGNSYAGITSTTALSFTTIFSDPTLDKDITGIINTQTILANESVNYSIETINNRLSFLRQNRYSNKLSKNNISLQFNDPALSTLVSAVSAQKTNNEEYANSEWSYWTEGTFSMGSIGENNTSSLIELESTGVAFGLDKNVNTEQLYGVSFQYLQTDSDIGTKGSSV